MTNHERGKKHMSGAQVPVVASPASQDPDTEGAGTPKRPSERAAQRRSQRVLLVVPVQVVWTTKDGVRVQEAAQTEVVNQHGALLKMEASLAVGTRVEISRPAVGRSLKARVVGSFSPGKDGLPRVAIELLVPTVDFWGISFPPLRTPAG